MNSSKDLTPSEKMRSALPQGHGRNGAHPVLIFVLGALTIGLAFSCCICGIGAWWFRPVFSEDPEKARELTAEIVSISIPETFVPHGTIRWNLGFVISLQGVYYERLVGEGVLTLLEVNTRIANDDSIRRHIRATLLEEGSSGSQLVVDRTKTRKESFAIAGEPVVFTIDLARDPRTNEMFHVVEGAFQGNSGQVLLTLKVDSTRWLDEPASIDPMPIGSAEQSLPRWLTTMLGSIGKGAAAEPAVGGSPEIRPVDPVLLPSAAPSPAPGPLN